MKKSDEREKIKEVLRTTEKAERKYLSVSQKAKRQELKEMQAKRRKENATTKAGGKREGAGRRPSLPHEPKYVDGVDVNEKKTMTFYGSMDEKKAVLQFLNVWRELRFNPKVKESLLPNVTSKTMLELLTSGLITDGKQMSVVQEILPANVITMGECKVIAENGFSIFEETSGIEIHLNYGEVWRFKQDEKQHNYVKVLRGNYVSAGIALEKFYKWFKVI